MAQPTFYLEDLFVLTEYRRTQVGGRLIKTCAKTALAEGCGRMDFLVLDWNELALQFYKKHGLKVQREWLLHRAESEAIKNLAEMNEPKLT
jgi:GNAT superfamily N-acetyltransferase